MATYNKASELPWNKSIFQKFFEDLFHSFGIGTGSTKKGALSNLIASQTGSAMTDAAKEEIDYSQAAKASFFQSFESYPAQVQQVKDAGLNPMILSNNPGASASSAAQSGAQGTGSILDIFKLMMDYKLRKGELEQETRRNDISERIMPSIIHRNDAGAGLSEANTERVRAMMDYEIENLQARTDSEIASVHEKEASAALKRAGITVQEAEAALKFKQEALLAIQEKYGEQYWQNTIALQQAEYALYNAQTSRNFTEMAYLSQEIENLKTERENMQLEGIGIVIDNGKASHELSILAKEDENAERRITQENRGRAIENVSKAIGIATDAIEAGVDVYGAVVSGGRLKVAKQTADTYRKDVNNKIHDSRDRRKAAQQSGYNSGGYPPSW